MKQRIEWIDTAKGLGIICIILGHMGTGKLGAWFYTFHVPLFFFLSGYVFSSNYDFLCFFLKKVKGILIPYLGLGVPMLVFDTILTNESFETILCKFLLQERCWTLWYLSVLFLIYFLFYSLFKIVRSHFVIGAISLSASIFGYIYYRNGGGALPWNVDIVAMSMPFFFSGIWYKQKRSWKLDAGVGIVIGLFLNCILAYMYGGIDMYGGSYGLFPVTYITAMAGICFIISVSTVITIPLLQYIGKNSLIYFAWHQTIMFPIVRKFLDLCHYPLDSGNIMVSGLEKFIELVLILMITTILNEFILRTKIKFILGK